MLNGKVGGMMRGRIREVRWAKGKDGDKSRTILRTKKSLSLDVNYLSIDMLTLALPV